MLIYIANEYKRFSIILLGCEMFLQFSFFIFWLFRAIMIHAVNQSHPLMGVLIFPLDREPDASGCVSIARRNLERPIIILPPMFANIRRVDV
jgi:hypothetical protein